RRRQHRCADRPRSTRAHTDGRRRRWPRGAHALSSARAISRAHALRDRARDRPHAPDPRAHGAHSRAARRRPRLRRPPAAAAPAERRAALRAAGFSTAGAARGAARARASDERGGAAVYERARARSARATRRIAGRRKGRAMSASPGFAPDWPAPPRVRAWVTERGGGASTGSYATLNLATHVGDSP